MGVAFGPKCREALRRESNFVFEHEAISLCNRHPNIATSSTVMRLVALNLAGYRRDHNPHTMLQHSRNQLIVSRHAVALQRESDEKALREWGETQGNEVLSSVSMQVPTVNPVMNDLVAVPDGDHAVVGFCSLHQGAR